MKTQRSVVMYELRVPARKGAGVVNNEKSKCDV